MCKMHRPPVKTTSTKIYWLILSYLFILFKIRTCIPFTFFFKKEKSLRPKPYISESWSFRKSPSLWQRVNSTCTGFPTVPVTIASSLQFQKCGRSTPNTKFWGANLVISLVAVILDKIIKKRVIFLSTHTKPETLCSGKILKNMKWAGDAQIAKLANGFPLFSDHKKYLLSYV